MLKPLESITILSVLVALALYVLISIIAASGDGFPFLVGALFLLAAAIAVVLIGINISLWSHKRARYCTSAIGKIGAWIITAGIVIAVAAVITQLFRAGGFWEPLFSELIMGNNCSYRTIVAGVYSTYGFRENSLSQNGCLRDKTIEDKNCH